MTRLFITTIPVLLALLLLLSKMADCYNCNNVVFEESEGLQNYLATIKFKIPVELQDEQWVMEMKTDHEFTFLGGWGIWVMNRPAEGKSTFKSRAENITMSQDEELSFRFRIQWFTNEPRPKVISLIWQDHQICSNSNDDSSTHPIAAIRRRRTYDDRSSGIINDRRRSSTRMRMPVN